MKPTVEEYRELTDLIGELRRIVILPTSDGNGLASPEMEKKKTAEFLRITGRLAALAKEIARNGEPKKEPSTASEMYGAVAKKVANAANPETMELIRRDGERADIVRAKRRADETLAAFSRGKKKTDAAPPEKTTNAAPDDVEAARARADATLFKRRS